jgi:hypothetical protein
MEQATDVMIAATSALMMTTSENHGGPQHDWQAGINSHAM